MHGRIPISLTGRALFLVLPAALLLLLAPRSSALGTPRARTRLSPRPKVHKSAYVHSYVTATRASDGTITARAVYRSSNRHCLWHKGLRPNKVDGYWHTIGAVLTYGGPFPLFHSKTGDDGSASPPENGWLSPVRRAARVSNGFVTEWKAVWPGASVVRVENFDAAANGLPVRYKATVAEASGLWLTAYIGGGFTTKYGKPGHRVVLGCRRTPIPPGQEWENKEESAFLEAVF